MTAPPEQRGFNTTAVRRYDDRGFSTLDVGIVHERTLEVLLNDQPVASIACLGAHVTELAVGFLRSEGLIAGKNDLKHVDTVPGDMAVRVYTQNKTAPFSPNRRISVTSSGARSHLDGMPDKIQTAGRKITCSPERIFGLMDSMVAQAQIHEWTRGTHCAALADADGVAVLREDIGRHNCLDMLGGYCLLNDITGADKILLRTGRVSSEIIRKVWTLETKLVVSLSVPTTAAMDMAERSGITLIGAVRDRRMTIYTHAEQIGDS